MDSKNKTKLVNQGVYDVERESELVIKDFKVNVLPKKGQTEEMARIEAAKVLAESKIKESEVNMQKMLTIVSAPPPAKVSEVKKQVKKKIIQANAKSSYWESHGLIVE
jgi:hypothetical protein